MSKMKEVEEKWGIWKAEEAEKEDFQTILKELTSEKEEEKVSGLLMRMEEENKVETDKEENKVVKEDKEAKKALEKEMKRTEFQEREDRSRER